LSEEISWVERARALVAYHQEALDFIRRAGEHLPASPSHALALCRLWVEADALDMMLCSLLDEMNAHLLNAKAEMDTTRGASMRPSVLDEERLFYDCSWTLLWERNRGVSVNLSVEAETGAFEARVLAMRSRQSHGIRFPIVESNLKEALTNAYFAEATHGGSGS
jgi:hypothetical protein